MAITKADLIGWAQEVGAFRTQGGVFFPSDDAVVTFSMSVRGKAVNESPTVPDSLADAFIDETGKIQELLQNSHHPIVRALARRVKLLAGG